MADQVNNQDNDGWGDWSVVPPTYRGVNLREYLQYSGPSLMDGVPSENNVSDDPQDEWSVYSDVSAAADALVHDLPTKQLHFVRAGGDNVGMNVGLSVEFLNWVWHMHTLKFR